MELRACCEWRPHTLADENQPSGLSAVIDAVSPMTTIDDRILIERVLRGERAAFGELLDRYQKVVYNVAIGIVGNQLDAEDVTQTVFLKVYENLSAFNPQFRFFSWLYRIAVNESLNAKKQKRQTTDLDEDVAQTGAGPEESAESLDLEDKIGAAMMFLTPENRAIVLLRHYQEFSYREIAYIMDLSEAKIKARLYSARQRLGKILLSRGLHAEL